MLRYRSSGDSDWLRPALALVVACSGEPSPPDGLGPGAGASPHAGGQAGLGTGAVASAAAGAFGAPRTPNATGGASASGGYAGHAGAGAAGASASSGGAAGSALGGSAGSSSAGLAGQSEYDFEEQGGKLVFEAEHFRKRTSAQGTQWITFEPGSAAFTDCATNVSCPGSPAGNCNEYPTCDDDVDKLYLSQSPQAPTGLGPAETR